MKKNSLMALMIVLAIVNQMNGQCISVNTNTIAFDQKGNSTYAVQGNLIAQATARYQYVLTKTGTDFVKNLTFSLNGLNWAEGGQIVVNNGNNPFAYSGYVIPNVPCGTTETVKMDIYNGVTKQLVCTSTFYFTIATFSINGPTTFCGSSANFSATNGSGGPYTWTSSNPAFTISGNGTANITLSSSSSSIGTTLSVSGPYVCPKSIYVFKGVPAMPTGAYTALIDPSDFHCFSNAWVDVTAGATSYVWTKPYAQTTVEPKNTMTLQKNRTYTITVSGANVCGTGQAWSSVETTENCAARVATDIAVENEASEIAVFPNPAIASFQVNVPSTSNTTYVRIVNVSGQTVKEVSGVNTKFTISTDELSEGIYFVHVRSGDINKVSKLQVIK